MLKFYIMKVLLIEVLIEFTIRFWLVFAFGMSFFWSIRSLILFGGEKFWTRSHEFIFNFIGSFFGWSCFLALLIRTHSYLPTFTGFTSGDIILFFISLLGLTGYLPQTTYGIVRGIGDLIKKGTDKL